MLGFERAIVSELPGTTRDYLEAELSLGKVLLQIIDTAGTRDTVDSIEGRGLLLARKQAQRADLVLFLVDTPESANFYFAEKEAKDKNFIDFSYDIIKKDHAFFSEKAIGVNQKGNKEALTFTVFNKIDLISQEKRKILFGDDVQSKITNFTCISCKTGEGIKILEKKMLALLFDEKQNKNRESLREEEDSLLLEERQFYHLQNVKESIKKILELMKEDTPEEIISVEWDTALDEIGAIYGEISTEEILGRIFSTFCIGK